MKKVFVGMSGGVDSSVSAYLLQKKGYEVTGVFIKTWSPDWMPCTWKEERLDALRVAVHLNIPLITLDAEKEYREKIAEYMINEYRSGHTPNPDFFCNNFIKFGLSYDYAMSLGADFVATGHYARNVGYPHCRGSTSPLMVAKDRLKDQSYFLAGIKKEQLSKIIFPIGDLQKSEVRDIARRAKLPVAEKKDSQGLCFLGPVNIEEFLSHYISTHPGHVLDKHGAHIGTHTGAEFFTLGQRHGFIITNKKYTSESLYVIHKNVRNNSITVEEKLNLSLTKNILTLIEVNRFVDIKNDEEYTCQLRYRQNLVGCKINGNKIKLLETPSDLPTSGQICVIYNGEAVVGSGVIDMIG